MQKQNVAAEHLQQRLADHPRLPAATRHVMAALATDAAKPAWDFFGHDDATVGRVLSRVRQAFEQALANARELAEMVSKSNTEAFAIINKRVTESLQELKALVVK